MDIYIIFLHIEASTITAVCLCKCVSLCKQFGPFFPTALLQFIQVCRHSLMPQCHSISVRLTRPLHLFSVLGIIVLSHDFHDFHMTLEHFGIQMRSLLTQWLQGFYNLMLQNRLSKSSALHHPPWQLVSGVLVCSGWVAPESLRFIQMQLCKLKLPYSF